MLAFVNGMGGTPLLELYIVYAEVARLAEEHGLKIERNLIGNYITSLEMQGCSITLLRLDDELIELLGRAGRHPGAALGRVTWRSTATACSAGCELFAQSMAEHRQELIGSTPRSATATTAPTWTAACRRRSRSSRPILSRIRARC